jgi:hypothetical protein
MRWRQAARENPGSDNATCMTLWQSGEKRPARAGVAHIMIPMSTFDAYDLFFAPADWRGRSLLSKNR